ncbi:LysE family translocator [Streptomyces qinglanensis]|uniref:Threonine/homoserine/homoserine lactone efflux protein n=1 Tax=Streptomyces qinglanensis TaxID=943816 RepID=A0A1H9RCQ4_9ACTN|nr:LysE family translocator [Streptomyces qinglanensis]SER70448.1 Threonine/homoserine/homoserine lactone efflux protein [Streptomyces qinglanensis]
MEFLLTALVVVLTPGTGVLFTIAAGLAHGRRTSLVAALGCTLGILPQALATLCGLAALLHTSAVAFQVLKYAGAAYLLWMAWGTLRDTSTLRPPDEPGGAPRSASRVVGSAVLLNCLNPKLTLFFLAFLPQFVRQDDPHAVWRMAELSGVFMLLTLLVFAGYGLAAAAMRDHIISRPRVVRWLRRSFAGAFAALGAHLAFF